MEFLYLSPEFPPNYANFILQLDKMNVNVWGIGEADFYSMPEKLRSALRWYIRANLNSFAEVEKAVEQLLSAKISLGTPPHFDRVEYAENPPVFREAMGKYRYILRSASESEIHRMADFVLRKP
ncbi:MAG: hypothetical protein ABII68_07390 [Pseudomonadota bacterium]